MTDTTIPCEKTTKEDISDIQEDLNEIENYYVTQDLTLQELRDSYYLLSQMLENTTEDKVKALAQGKASIEYEDQTGKGKGQGAQEDEGRKDNQ